MSPTSTCPPPNRTQGRSITTTERDADDRHARTGVVSIDSSKGGRVSPNASLVAKKGRSQGSAASTAPPGAPASTAATAPSRDPDPAAKIRADLEARIGTGRYRRWFGRTEIEVDGDALEVRADSHFTAKSIDQLHGDALRAAAHDALGVNARINLSVLGGQATDRTAAPTLAPANPAPPKTNGERSPRRAAPPLRQLDDFVVGRCNELAFTSACRIVDEPNAAAVSPLCVYGGSGLGKTHLLQGICARFRDQAGRGAKARYMTAEQFTNEFLAALRKNTLEQFRQQIRRLDLLAIDDVHFFENKTKTQSEFLHTLEAINLTGARLVLASSEHPRLARFSRVLVSRLLSGMVVQVERPPREVRIAIVKQLSTAIGNPVNDVAAEYIASRCVGSVHELQGAVTTLKAMHYLARDGRPSGGPATPEVPGAPGPGTTTAPGGDGKEIGLVLARRLFEDERLRPQIPVRISTVVDVVCEQLGVARADLMSRSRHRRVVLGRALVAYLGRDMTTHSYPEIARELGRPYHSSVHTAEQRFKKQLEANDPIEAGDGKAAVEPRELRDQLRHAILRATARS